MPDAALEQEIIARVRQLDTARQQRVLEFLRSMEKPALSDAEWLEQAQELREQLRAKYGDDVYDDNGRPRTVPLRNRSSDSQARRKGNYFTIRRPADTRHIAQKACAPVV